MAVIDKLRLLRGLLDGERAWRGPFFVDVDLANVCDQRCVGCPFHAPDERSQPRSGPPFIDPDMLLRVARELRRLGTQEMVLQGAGEPLLHPHCVEIVGALKAQGYQLGLLTNGRRLDQRTARDLVETGLDRLRVSVWALSPEERRHNHPGGDPDAWRLGLEGLARVHAARRAQRRRRPLLHVHFPINRSNHGSLGSAVEQAVRVGADGISFSPFFPLRGERDGEALEPAEERQICGHLRALRPALGRHGLWHNVDETLLRYRLGPGVWRQLPCYVMWYHARILCSGEVHPCGRCDRALGDLSTASFEEVWNSRPVRAFRRQAMTTGGLARLGDRCDCNYCCYAKDNLRVHRLFRWLAPRAPQREPGAGCEQPSS